MWTRTGTATFAGFSVAGSSVVGFSVVGSSTAEAGATAAKEPARSTSGSAPVSRRRSAVIRGVPFVNRGLSAIVGGR